MRIHAVLTAIALLAAPTLCHAMGMKITPGKWQMTRTTSSPTGGAPQTETATECIQEEMMTPQQFMSQMKECLIFESNVQESSMSWKMTCPSSEAPMTGVGSFRSTGMTISGSLTLNVKLGEQQFPMENAWSGKRVGDCK